MGDGVDPQPRVLAAADAAIEQVDRLRNLVEQRIERLVQELEASDLGVVQVDDDGRSLGVIDARLAQRIAQPRRRLARSRRFGIPTFTTPHDPQPSNGRRQGKRSRRPKSTILAGYAHWKG